MLSRFSWVLPGLILLSGSLACGGDDDDSTLSPTPSTNIEITNFSVECWNNGSAEDEYWKVTAEVMDDDGPENIDYVWLYLIDSSGAEMEDWGIEFDSPNQYCSEFYGYPYEESRSCSECQSYLYEIEAMDEEGHYDKNRYDGQVYCTIHDAGIPPDYVCPRNRE